MPRVIHLLSLCVWVCPPSVAAADAERPEVLRLLPAGELGDGIRSTGEAEHFGGKKLFDYMNGGAELYLAYGFADLGVRTYRQGGLTLEVALHRMGSPAEAFGIYAFGAGGKRVEVGGPASLAPNMLSFFKGRYYVRVVAPKASEQAARAMMLLGRKVFGALPGEAKVPAALRALPKGEVSGSRRFLTNPQTAQTVWFDGEGALLLTAGAHAVCATYAGDEEDVQLTRASYPNATAASAACQALAKKLGLVATAQPGTCKAAGKTAEDVFVALATEGTVLRWVSGAADEKDARLWLSKIRS